MPARILVIEDNLASRELAVYLLAKRGHTVEAAENGAQGLAVAERMLPDLILCDLQMPEMDGYDFISSVRTHARLASVPVVTVTAFSMPGDETRAMAAGFDGYLSKPIDPMRFCEQVEAFLGPAPRGAPRG
jgi:two-component system cell cycle response regulator DivK